MAVSGLRLVVPAEGLGRQRGVAFVRDQRFIFKTVFGRHHGHTIQRDWITILSWRYDRSDPRPGTLDSRSHVQPGTAKPPLSPVLPRFTALRRDVSAHTFGCYANHRHITQQRARTDDASEP